MCTFSCVGERYDVDGNMANGCEVLDTPQFNHLQSSAISVGSLSCFDTNEFNLSGRVLSDTRFHEPAIAGFVPATGAAPDWFRIFGEGGTFCINDLDVTFTTSGGTTAACTRLTVITTEETRSCTLTGNDSCSFTNVDYDNDSNIFFKVENVCPASGGQVTYTIRGNM
jgi:hypothetical protein